ncbi:MAG: TonB-dependent receptor [Nitrococcus sp.]|nr:TonB-dependent receptor [Nitrococcus sp.]
MLLRVLATAVGLALVQSTVQAEGRRAARPVEQDAATKLPALTVTANPVSGYNIPKTTTAAGKMPVEITNVPQSVQVITRDVFEDQGAQSINDIMTMVPSATLVGSRFANFPGFTIRGFGAEVIRNGIRQIFFADVDSSALSHIQSVQVLKGPGGVMFGNVSQGGGIVNIVTKRPYAGFGAEVLLTRGFWPGFDGYTTRVQWDFNAPLTADGALKARVTGEVEESDTFINFQELHRQNVGLALTYDNGGPVRAFINAEYQHRRTKLNPGLPAVGTVKGSGVGQISRDTFLGEPRFDRLTASGPLLQAWLEIDILDDWNGILKNWKLIPRYQYQIFSVEEGDTNIGDATVDPTNGGILVSRSGRSFFNEKNVLHIGQLDLTGIMETGPLTHQIYLSGNYLKQYLPQDPGHNLWFNRINVPDIDALNPTYLSSPPETNPDMITFGNEYSIWALAFQDLVSITRYFDLMGGVRYSHFSGTPRGNLSAQAGIKRELDDTSFQIGGTLHITDSVHLFSGYAEGFDFTFARKADGSLFPPTKFDQLEVGMKIDFPWGLKGTTSLYRATRSNVSTPDPNNAGFSIPTGEVRNRGAEIMLSYQVSPQLYFQGGYAFMDSEITQSNAGDEGNRFRNTPTHSANFWTHYRFGIGPLRNLTLSAGLRFVGDRPLTNANTVELPSFTTVNMGASYTYQNLQFELFANNLLDEHYFTAGPGQVFPGTPRSIVGRISYKY